MLHALRNAFRGSGTPGPQTPLTEVRLGQLVPINGYFFRVVGAGETEIALTRGPKTGQTLKREAAEARLEEKSPKRFLDRRRAGAGKGRDRAGIKAACDA